MGRNFIDMTGQRFGKYTVIDIVHRKGGAGKHIYWNCICDCGNRREVSGSDLRIRGTKMCKSCARTKHGKTNTPEYGVWCKIKSRCYNKSHKFYEYYGGRGISVCNRWLNSFENFYSDMGKRPSLKLSIDRIDNNGNYEPSNCRWATTTQQNNNTRVNHYLTIGNETYTIAQWARRAGIEYGTLNARINKCKWPPEKAVYTPVRKRR